MPGIFICYRRDDASPYAGRLYDHLSARFGTQRVFMDIDTIRPGDDFVQVISDRVAACEVLIAVIGKRWLTSADSRGRRRLEDPNDYVRIEIASALSRNLRVIPALVDGAQMPPARELPPDLAPLARRNAIEVTNTMFRQNVELLIQALEQSLRPGPLSLHRAFKMKLPVAREQPKPRGAAAPSQRVTAILSGPVLAGAGAFFLIQVLVFALNTAVSGRLVLITLLQCAALFAILSARALGDALDRQSAAKLAGCWLATVVFKWLIGTFLSNGYSTSSAAGLYFVAMETAGALAFGALVRWLRPWIGWRPVLTLARTWGLASLLALIATLLANTFAPRTLVWDLYQIVIGGGILWLIRQKPN